MDGIMKPTNAEIKYFTHPDQAWLQEDWTPAVGDWWTNPSGRGPWLITHPWPDDREKWGGAIWLPTLSDLVSLIEQKDRSWSIQGYLNMGTCPTEDTLDYDGLVWQIGGVVEHEIFFDYGRVPSATIIAAELLEKLKNV